MKDATTILQQIKDSLPKYRYLTPGVDVWQEGDECWVIKIEKWCEVTTIFMGKIIEHECVRRPIPSKVLENQAFWVLYNKLATVLNGDGYIFATKNLVAPKGKYDTENLRIVSSGWFGQFDGYKFKRALDAGHAISLLGGEQNIIKHLSAGDLYSKWLGEQLT